MLVYPALSVPCDMIPVMLNIAMRVLLLKRGELLFRRNVNLSAVNTDEIEFCELRKRSNGAVHLSVAEVEIVEFSVVPKQG